MVAMTREEWVARAIGRAPRRAPRFNYFGDTNESVILYKDANYSGSSQVLPGPGDYDLSQLSIGNDQLSSIRVPSWYRVTLFKDWHFQGASLVLTQDVANLGWYASGWNDVVSSIRVEKIGQTPEEQEQQAAQAARAQRAEAIAQQKAQEAAAQAAEQAKEQAAAQAAADAKAKADATAAQAAQAQADAVAQAKAQADAQAAANAAQVEASHNALLLYQAQQCLATGGNWTTDNTCVMPAATAASAAAPAPSVNVNVSSAPDTSTSTAPAASGGGTEVPQSVPATPQAAPVVVAPARTSPLLYAAIGIGLVLILKKRKAS